MYDLGLKGWKDGSGAGEPNKDDLVSILKVLVPLFPDVSVVDLVKQVADVVEHGPSRRQAGAEGGH